MSTEVLSSRPSREAVLIRMAELTSMRSTCSRLHVGCVVSRDGRILVTGYNGAPSKMPHCDHTCTCNAPNTRFPSIHEKGCPADYPCEVSVHAEVNVIAFAAKYGISLDESCLVTTASPCLACAQLIINAGINTVFYRAAFRDERGIALLHSGGVLTAQV